MLQAPLLAEAGPCQAGCSCAPCVSQHLHAKCCGGAQAELTLKLRCHASAAVLLSCICLGQDTASRRERSAPEHRKLCSCNARTLLAGLSSRAGQAGSSKSHAGSTPLQAPPCRTSHPTATCCLGTSREGTFWLGSLLLPSRRQRLRRRGPCLWRIRSSSRLR